MGAERRIPGPVLCLITGQPTPIPRRGPRSMYVNREAGELKSRLSQVDNLVTKLADEVGFTPEAQLRFRRLCAAIAEIAQGRHLEPARTRSKDQRAMVRLDPSISEAIDAMPGHNRTLKVQLLLAEALQSRSAALDEAQPPRRARR